jgi:hypothetical protein
VWDREVKKKKIKVVIPTQGLSPLWAMRVLPYNIRQVPIPKRMSKKEKNEDAVTKHSKDYSKKIIRNQREAKKKEKTKIK